MQWETVECKKDIGWTEKNGCWVSGDVSGVKEPIIHRIEMICRH
jgi:hypothetical protein